jgi:hypothetical protein
MGQKKEREVFMFKWNQYEQSKFHLWPWEDDEEVSAAEFERSLKSLNCFLDMVNVEALYTLEDLSAVASLVGHDIHTVAVAKGKRIEKKTEEFEPGSSEPISTVKRIYAFSRILRDQEVAVTASGGYASISEKKSTGFQREELRVRLPADRDIAIGNTPNVDEQSIFAIDVQGWCLREYYPVREPSNPEIQQGFIAVLMDAVRDVVAVLGSTAQAPSV